MTNKILSFACIALLLLSLLTVPRTVSAAEPYEINVILPLTGSATFLGQQGIQALKAIETTVNRTGGIRGRPIKFTVQDDQSSPQVAVQLLNGVIARGAAVVLGSKLVANCRAMIPLIEAHGPLLYCLSPGVYPPAGSYAFAASFTAKSLIAAGARYQRQRGWKRVAVIATTDGTGQDGEAAYDEALALPENKSITVVDREHFNVSDLSVVAQVARIKASGAQAVFTWFTGTPTATFFRAMREVGLDIPVFASPSNLSRVQMDQYKTIMPKDVYFAGVISLNPSAIRDRATKKAVDSYVAELESIGVTPEFSTSTAWDPILLIVDALRKLGTGATAAQIHDYLESLTGWVGINGRYDFRAYPQRGLGTNGALMVKWDEARETSVLAEPPPRDAK